MSSTRMNSLAARRNRVLERAHLHRQIIAAEHELMALRAEALREQVASHRWLLVAGAAAGLVLVTRSAPLLRWLPGVVGVWRLLR